MGHPVAESIELVWVQSNTLWQNIQNLKNLNFFFLCLKKYSAAVCNRFVPRLRLLLPSINLSFILLCLLFDYYSPVFFFRSVFCVITLIFVLRYYCYRVNFRDLSTAQLMRCNCWCYVLIFLFSFLSSVNFQI